MAWLTGWLYRKSITISRASGAVTNYQMKLKVGESAGAVGEDVDCGGFCQADFDDLRFTTSDETTLLDYYIELQTGISPNRLATLWIKFNSIGTGDTTFYMYYGNAAAVAVSNGTNTFLMFEDANNLNSAALNGQNGWTSAANNYVVAATYAYEGAKGIGINGGGVANNTKKDIVGASSYNVSIQAQMRSGHTVVNYNNAIYLYEGANQLTGVYFHVGFITHLKTGTVWENIVAYTANIFYKIRIDLLSASTHAIYVNDAIQVLGSNINNANVSSAVNKTALEQASSTGVFGAVDQIMVRHFRTPEPVFGSWGPQITEEDTIRYFTYDRQKAFAQNYEMP